MIAQSSLDAESTDIVRDYVNELLAFVPLFFGTAENL
jgi:hypothetical protein